MVTIEDFREIIRKDWEEEKKRKSVEVWGATVSDALKEASIELSIPVNRLEYEVQIRGYAGLFGLFFKKEWRLLVYPAENYTPTKLKSHEVGVESEQGENLVKNIDGDFGLRLAKDGKIYIRVTAPQGEGKVVVTDDIFRQIESTRFLPDIDKATVSKIVKARDGEWHEVAEYHYSPHADFKINVSISDDDMKAFMTITTPASGGSSPSFGEMREALTNAGVFFGIKEDVITATENHPVYKTSILVAEGEPARDGDNTKVKFLFETDFNKKEEEKFQRSKSAVIDFKDNNRIQSVHEGEVVAEVIPPEQGREGRTVRGNLIPARDGEVIDVPLGNNVKLSDDGTQIIATSSGQALLVKGVVNVETINVINGDVKSHINFLGTVVIKGDVGDGYEIFAQGDIHVSGTVGRSKLQAGGNIYVDGGVNGAKTSEEETASYAMNIKCGKSFWGRFLQNCSIEAGEFVIVSDGILHSDVIGLRKVLCRGKRAAIVGGTVRASEEINASVLGSVSGTPTRLEVGFDPRLKDELNMLVAQREELERVFIEIDRSLNNWLQAAKGKTLPPDKQKRIEEMQIEKDDKGQQIKKLTVKIKETMDSMNEREFAGKISAAQRVYSGVHISINDAIYDVTNEYSKGVTFYEHDNLINMKDYEDITDDISKENAVPIPSTQGG